MSNGDHGNEAIASFEGSESILRPKFPIIYNPILVIGVMSIVLWAAILGGVAVVWR